MDSSGGKRRVRQHTEQFLKKTDSHHGREMTATKVFLFHKMVNKHEYSHCSGEVHLLSFGEEQASGTERDPIEGR